MLSDRELTDRQVMAWFRRLSGEEQEIVRVGRRSRGYTPTRPRRRLPDGRNVWCRQCPAERNPVWLTNEWGDAARRAAQIAAARHLRGHLRPDARTGTAPETPR